MKLRFIYLPTPDLSAALGFYRDTLGWSEAWREGADTVAFALPDSDVQVMVATTSQPVGAMYQVPDLAEFLNAHPTVHVQIKTYEIPDGYVCGISDPAGNLVYVFDQSLAD